MKQTPIIMKMYNQPKTEVSPVQATTIILAGSILPGPPVKPEDPIQEGD